MAVTRTSAPNPTAAAGTAGITVVPNTGAAAGDFGRITVETANQSMATPSGWTQAFAGAGFGTAGAAGGSKPFIFVKQSISAGDVTGVTLADSGDHQIAIFETFSGVDTTTPYVIGTEGASSAATTSVATGAGPAGITTSDLVHGICTTDRDSATVSTNTSSNWSGFGPGVAGTFVANVSSASGAGGGIIVNELVPANNESSTVQWTCSITSSAYASVVMVLKAASVAVAPTVGHLTFGGKVPSLTLALNPATGHLTFGGKVPSVMVGASLNPAAGHLAFTGYQASITRTTAVAPSVGHLAFGGKVPSVTRTTALSPAAGHLAFGGKVASVSVTTNVSPSSGHLTFSGKVPALTFTTALSPATGHLTFGGKVPSVALNVNLTPSVGHLAFTGKAPSLTIGINPATGHLVFTGYVPDVSGTVAPSTSNPLKVAYRHRGRNC